MGILKLLYEEPEKLQSLIINFIKLLLTLLIAHSFFDLNELNSLGSITDLNPKINIKDTLYYLVLIIVCWFVIWTLFYGLFLVVTLIFKSPNSKIKRKNNQLTYEALDHFLIYKTTKGGYKYPKKHINNIVEIGKLVKENDSFSMRDTLFLDIVFIAIIIWGYFITITPYGGTALTYFISSGIVLILLILLIRFLEKLLDAFKENSTNVYNILKRFHYRRMIIEVIENIFNGSLNENETSLIMRVKSKEIEILDYREHNDSLGNIRLKEIFRKKTFNEQTLIISNVNPDEELSNFIKENNLVGYIVAENEDELIDRISKLLTAL